MAQVTARNRNKNKFYKDGRPKAPNWEYRFEAAPIGGKRNQISQGGFATEKEALIAGNQAFNQYTSIGQLFKPSELSVSDYLDYWLKNIVHKKVGHDYAQNTYDNYSRIVKNHLKPAFGQYRLSALQNTPDVVQNFVDELKIKGYSRGMIKGTLSCLSTAMNYAVIPLKYITSNPCIYVKVGKVKANPDRDKHTEYICSNEDFKKIMQRFPEDSNFYLPLLLPYCCGTRIAETYGINLLTDVDFSNHTIRINQQLVKNNGSWRYMPPKYNSCRTIKIGNSLEKALKHEVRKRKENILRYGEYFTKTYIDQNNILIQLPATMQVPYTEVWPVSVRENGELLTPDSFKYCARVIHYDLGMSLFHSHSLRHTHGTILAENGVNAKTIMERLGHKDITTTLQTYIFNTNKMQLNAVDTFEAVVESVL